MPAGVSGTAATPANNSLSQESLSLKPQLSVQPADAAVQVGKEFRIDVFARKAHAITGEIVKLMFDPQVVEFREAAEGELMGAARGKAAVAVKSRASDGEMELRFRRLSTSSKSEGQLLSLIFVAKAPGVSPVNVTLPGEAGGPGAANVGAGKGIVRVR
jgi:hypothetical protein